MVHDTFLAYETKMKWLSRLMEHSTIWKWNQIAKRFIGCPRETIEKNSELSMVDLERLVSKTHYRVIADKHDVTAIRHNQELAERQADTEYVSYLKDLTAVPVKKKIQIELKRISDDRSHQILNLYITRNELQRTPRINIEIDAGLSSTFGLEEGTYISMYELHKMLTSEHAKQLDAM